MHSAFYRGPKAFKDQTVLVVGAGPSGLDGSLQIGRTAKKVSLQFVSSSYLMPKIVFCIRYTMQSRPRSSCLRSGHTKEERVCRISLQMQLCSAMARE
jgi:cation diffusion facilitator CzcD-associated flavoprotein CzcO